MNIPIYYHVYLYIYRYVFSQAVLFQLMIIVQSESSLVIYCCIIGLIIYIIFYCPTMFPNGSHLHLFLFILLYQQSFHLMKIFHCPTMFPKGSHLHLFLFILLYQQSFHLMKILLSFCFFIRLDHSNCEVIIK